MRRPWWLLGVIVLGAACSTTSTCPNSALVYVDLPGGTEGTSFSATGACGEIPGGCVPLGASCQTPGCACRITLQVNFSTFDASPDGVCHIEAASSDGGVFSKDLPFMSKGGSCFDVSGPVGTIVLVQLSAGPKDAGGTDGGGDAQDAGADAAATATDAGAGDATDAG
jgi:hypothetical protein